MAGIAPTAQHLGLAMAANVGHQLDAPLVVDQHLSTPNVIEHVKVARFGHHQTVADVIRASAEQAFEFALVDARVDVPVDLQLGRRGLQK